MPLFFPAIFICWFLTGQCQLIVDSGAQTSYSTCSSVARAWAHTAERDLNADFVIPLCKEEVEV